MFRAMMLRQELVERKMAISIVSIEMHGATDFLANRHGSPLAAMGRHGGGGRGVRDHPAAWAYMVFYGNYMNFPIV
jgi:hypothetical protein